MFFKAAAAAGGPAPYTLGTIVAFRAEDGTHQVLFDGGRSEQVCIARERVDWQLPAGARAAAAPGTAAAAAAGSAASKLLSMLAAAAAAGKAGSPAAAAAAPAPAPAPAPAAAAPEDAPSAPATLRVICNSLVSMSAAAPARLVP
jgi:hypothetical protein